jgi:hypothetical protein
MFPLLGVTGNKADDFREDLEIFAVRVSATAATASRGRYYRARVVSMLFGRHA